MTDTSQKFGDYTIDHSIGMGPFAESFVGKNADGQQAVIKVFHKDGKLSQEDKDSFFNVAKTLEYLTRPHIIRILGHGFTDEDTPYLIMEYFPQGSLRKKHPVGTTVSLNDIVDYVKQVAQVIQHAHNHDVIHQDLKPENLLVGNDDEITVSDFCTPLLVRALRPETAPGTIGTPLYMAPEQFEGKPIEASDQYMLAVIVYEWLTGDTPFHGSTIEQLRLE